MPPSTPRKRRAASPTRLSRQRPSVAGLADMLAQLEQSAPDSALNPQAVAKFDEILTRFGDGLMGETLLLSKSEVYTPRIYLFEKEGNRWEVAELLSGAPAYAGSSVSAIGQHLRALTRLGGPQSVAAMFFVPPESKKLPPMQLALFCDAEGTIASGLGTDKLRWTSLDGPISLLIAQVQRLGLDGPAGDDCFFADRAKGLLAELNKCASPDSFEELVEAFLRGTMLHLGSADVQAGYVLTRNWRSMLERMRLAFEDELSAKVEQMEKVAKAQAKSLTAQLTKAEMLAKGSCERAERLTAELQALRKQVPAAAGPVPEVQVRKALDLLFP